MTQLPNANWGNVQRKKKRRQEPFFELTCPKFYGQKLSSVELIADAVLFRFENCAVRELRNVVTGSERRVFVVGERKTFPLGTFLSLQVVETKALRWKSPPFINSCKLELRTEAATATFYATTTHDGTSNDASGFRFHFAPPVKS